MTICYRDVLRPTAFRKAELLKSYYFECLCERCKDFLFDKEMDSVLCPNKCGTEVRGNLNIIYSLILFHVITTFLTSQVNVKQSQECPECNVKFDEDYIEKVAETEEATKMKIAEMGDNACEEFIYSLCLYGLFHSPY